MLIFEAIFIAIIIDVVKIGQIEMKKEDSEYEASFVSYHVLFLFVVTSSFIVIQGMVVPQLLSSNIFFGSKRSLCAPIETAVASEDLIYSSVPLTSALLNLPKGKSLGRSKPATNS